MASRVSITIAVRDATREGLRQVRSSFSALQRHMRTVRTTILTRGPSTGRLNVIRRHINRVLGRTVTVPIRAGTRGFVGSLRSTLRSLGGFVSGTMQDGIGQGIINGFRAGGPVGVAVLAAIIAGSAAVIGAALSGLIVTALGAAFVGIGVVSAFQSKKVQETWDKTLANLKQEFKDVGEPLIPVLDRALGRLNKMVDVAGPKLKKAIEETAPATEKFIQSLMDGFESFGKAAFDPIMEAWNVFAPVFGEEWNEFMDELGNSFGRMADLVKEHPTEIAAALDIVFEALDLLVDTVTFFGQAWATAMQAAYKGTALLVQFFAGFVEGILDSLGAIVEGAAKAFGWVPGLGGKLKDASRAFSSWKDGAVEKLNAVSAMAEHMGGTLDRANKKRRLEADIASWQSKLQRARSDLRRTTSQKARAKVQANIDQLERNLRRARAQLDAINGKTVVTWTYNNVQTRYVPAAVGSPGGVGAANAHGGVRGLSAAATGGVRSNLTLVGEQGPEVIDLAPGSRVRSNPDTRRLLRGQGKEGGGVGVLEIVSNDAAMLQLFRRIVRKAGGDFDVVFRKGKVA